MKTRRFIVFSLVVSLLLLTSMGTAQQPTDKVTSRSQAVELTDLWNEPTNTVAVQGKYAYAGMGLTLVVVDVSSPTSPKKVGQTAQFPGIVQDVDVAGEYAYVVAEEALHVIDISDPVAPLEIGTYDTPGQARGIDVARDPSPALRGSGQGSGLPSSAAKGQAYAYVAAGRSGLRVIDVSDPTAPREVGAYETPGASQDVYVLGGYAYVADGPGGLRIVDISDPAVPHEVGALDTLDRSLGIYAVGHHVYLADGRPGLRIVDVSEPTRPVNVGTSDTPGYAQDVHVADGHAYVADGWAGLQVIDISDPAQPTQIGALDTPGTAHGIAVAGGPSTPNGSRGDSDRRSEPALSSVLSFVACPEPSRREGLPKGQVYAYVADGEPGLQVVDISDPAAPVDVVTVQEPADWNVRFVGQIGGGPTEAVTVQGNRAYIGVGSWFAVLDITDPANPKKLSQGPKLPDILQDIAVAGDYAYVATGDVSRGKGGLWVIDVSDPTKPVPVGSYENVPIRGVDVVGKHAYVAANVRGLRVLDISDPAAPREIGVYEGRGSAYNVHIVGSYAYLANGHTGLRVLDVSDPTAPVEIGAYATPAWAFDVHVANGPSTALHFDADFAAVRRRPQDKQRGPEQGSGRRYAYVTTGGVEYAPPRLHVIDVSDPTMPVEVGVYELSGSGWDIDVAGSYAYIITDAGLHVIDVSDPTTPREVGTYQTPGYTQQVDVVGAYAYVADRIFGLRVIDVTDPTRLTETGAYRVSQYVSGVYATGNYAYVISSWRDLQIVDISNPATPEEVGAIDSGTLRNPRDVAVSGLYAYVAVSQDPGLRVFDISNPMAPREVGVYGPLATAVHIVGNYAYVAALDGLHVFDISRPNALREISVYRMPRIPSSVLVSGGYAYVRASSDLYIIDVSDPAAPVEVGIYETPWNVADVHVAGGPSTGSGQSYAYFAERRYPTPNLWVVDVSKPTAPVPVAVHKLPMAPVEDLYIDGQYAYVALSEAGLLVLDISNPTAPREVAAYDTPGDAKHVHVAGIYTYVADSNGGLLILRVIPGEMQRAYLPVVLRNDGAGQRTVE